jgi:hypothetical protein
MQESQTREEILNLFQIADQDKNGKLSREEVGAIMTHLNKGVKPSIQEINTCVSAMDSNGDGVVSESEFLQAMMNWLQIVNQSSLSLLSPPSSPGLSRRKTVSDLMNFFQQFAPIPNYQEEQKRILTRRKDSSDMNSISREYAKYTAEEKAAAYELIKRILFDGKELLIRELYSLDWDIVISAVQKVCALISIVELFPTPSSRYVPM